MTLPAIELLETATKIEDRQAIASVEIEDRQAGVDRREHWCLLIGQKTERQAHLRRK